MSKKNPIEMKAKFKRKNKVTLSVMDCIKFLQTIPDNSSTLVMTSPPYNVGKVYEKRLSLKEYSVLQYQVISECARVLKKNGNLCWVVGNHILGKQQILPLDIHLHPIFDNCGFILRNRIIWNFDHGLHCKKRFSGRYETILWYSKSEDYIFNLDKVRVPQKYPGKRHFKGPRKGEYSGNPLGKNPGDCWSIPNVKANHIEKTIHPCQFPVELAERLILALSNPKDLVVDPFMGVGSTAVAAVLNKRRVAGCDKNQQYLEIARRRVKLASKGELKTRPRDKKIHIPSENSKLLRRD